MIKKAGPMKAGAMKVAYPRALLLRLSLMPITSRSRNLSKIVLNKG